MMANLSLLVPVLFLALSLRGASSIKCWSCNSNFDPKCEDPFDNSTIPITNCKLERGHGGTPNMCQKIRKIVDGVQIITRGCALKNQDNITPACPTTSDGTSEVKTFCEICDSKDGCNGASSIGKTLALLIAPLGLLLFK